MALSRFEYKVSTVNKLRGVQLSSNAGKLQHKHYAKLQFRIRTAKGQ